MRDGARKSVPVGSLFLELLAAKPRERIILCTPVVLTGFPLGCNPALLLQLVQRRVQGTIAHLQYIARNLFQALANSPAVQRLQGENLQYEKVQGALDKIRWFAHFPTSLGYRY